MPSFLRIFADHMPVLEPHISSIENCSNKLAHNIQFGRFSFMHQTCEAAAYFAAEAALASYAVVGAASNPPGCATGSPITGCSNVYACTCTTDCRLARLSGEGRTRTLLNSTRSSIGKTKRNKVYSTKVSKQKYLEIPGNQMADVDTVNQNYLLLKECIGIRWHSTPHRRRLGTWL
jgi:hypothetical protein